MQLCTITTTTANTFIITISIIIAHIQEFAAGRVSWARGVNQWYDLTEEEWAAELGLGELVIVS